MPRRTQVLLCLAALTLPALAQAGCKSSGGTTGTSTGEPPSAPVPADQFCKELAQIACSADETCCDGAVMMTPPPVTTGTGAGGGTGGAGGSGTGGSGGMETPPPPPPPESCISKQASACDATAGKLVTDPRTGYDPERGGAFLAKAKTLAQGCWKEPIGYESFLAVLPGTGDLGSDCTPDDTSPAALRAAELSCKDGAACRLELRADGQARGTCQKREDDACSHALDCPGGQWCDLPSPWSPGVWGTCRPLRANGWACQGDLQCQSYTCAFDGKCAAADDKSLCLTRLYSSVVKADEPLAYYRLGETAGSSAEDASGHDHPGSRGGSPAPVYPGALAGDFDGATSFDGDDDKISAPAGIADGKSGLSLECWLSPADGSGGLPVLALDDDSNDGAVLAIGPMGDSLDATFIDTAGQSHTMSSPAASVTHDQWYHVVMTYDGSHGALYLDGAKAAELSGVFTPRAGGAFSIGATPYGSTYFKGSVDEVALYGSALTPYRVAQHRQVGKAGPSAGAWRFFTWLQ